jgi:CubicO group peptidase (beta-lactamase class C family)
MVRILCFSGLAVLRQHTLGRSAFVVLIFLFGLSNLLLANEQQGDGEFHEKLNRAWNATIQPQLQDAIKRGDFPGAVLCVGRKSGKPWMQAVGNRQVLPLAVNATTDTIYDLASLTKPLVTATLILKLHEEGKLDVDQPAAKYLRDFAVHGKEHITLRQLLLHTSGLIADNAMADFQDGHVTAMEKLLALKPIRPAGECFVYSDVGYLVLGQVIEHVTGKTLDIAAREMLFEPLRMQQTMYNPSKTLREMIAPQDKRDDRWLQGTVHDPRAAALNGVAGHAGVFSSASDLAHYAEMILNDGKYGGREFLRPETVRLMLAPETVPVMSKTVKARTATRTLGWDHQSPYSSNRGTKLSERAIGHGGFTGTTFWIDPEKQLYVIFLSNRLHPDSQGNVNTLVGKLTDDIVTALEEEPKASE